MQRETFKTNGQQITIASLSLAQVEALTQNQPAKGDDPAWIDRMMQTVVNGLNNGLLAVHGRTLSMPENEIPWDSTKVNEFFDLTERSTIHARILELSGLRTLTPGEAEAAAEQSTSVTSAAA